MSGPRLSIIPAGAIFDRSLEPRDLQVLNLLGCHTDKAGWCRRSQVKMAAELDCSRASVQRSLDRLVSAGWVQNKRPPWSNQEGQPSNSYMYRVVLDRDDEPETVTEESETGESDATESYAENANEEGGCSPVGTPAQPDEHPGAQTCVGTGAHTYVGTKNDPLERSPIERERDARARDRNARFIVDFEKRWPTAAADDRQRTAYAAEALGDEEQQAALAGIGPFLDHLKQHRRKNVPAGWRYLEEKRWTLLTEPAKGAAAPSGYPRDSLEAKALFVLHDIGGQSDFLWKVMVRGNVVYYSREVSARLKALSMAPDKDAWSVLTHQQAGAWEAFLRETIIVTNRRPLREGDRAPWPWPPNADGKLYTSATGPPIAELSDQDAADFV